MQRIYLSARPQANFRSEDSELHHQFTRVLRAKIGEHVCFFGEEWSCEYAIEEIGKHHIVFSLIRELPVFIDVKKITLFQSIPNRLEKAEYLVQKWVEVGVSKFVFFKSERTQFLAWFEKKLERLRLIAKEALEQSGGFVLPEIVLLDSIDSLLSSVEKIAVLHTGEQPKTLLDFASDSPDSVGILVGPEGWFSPSEIQKYEWMGAVPITLGKRILRTETAWVVAAFGMLQLSEK